VRQTNVLNYIGLLPLALLLSACVNVPSNYKLDASKSAGLVVGTITYDSSIGQYGLVVASQATGATTVLEVGSSMWPPLKPMHDDALNAKGSTFARELPAGKYQIASWQVRRGYRVSEPETSFQIAFSVEAGKATYLGNLHFDADWENVTLRDMSSRDLPILQFRFPALALNPVAFGIAPGTNLQKLGADYDTHLGSMPIFIPIPIAPR
jgi:hypothetical protein